MDAKGAKGFLVIRYMLSIRRPDGLQTALGPLNQLWQPAPTRR